MKREMENRIMEELKKGYRPVYAGEEGYVMITMNAYLAAAEYAGAEDLCFWYDDLCYDMIDVETREEEIEGGYFNFMPRKIKEDFEEISREEIESNICPNPEGRSDEIFSDLEDVNDMCMLINERIRALAGDLYELHCDMLLRPEEIEIENKVQDIVAEMAQYEKIFLRIIEYIRKKVGGEER